MLGAVHVSMTVDLGCSLRMYVKDFDVCSVVYKIFFIYFCSCKTIIFIFLLLIVEPHLHSVISTCTSAHRWVLN